jgi:hypothetical protein
VFDVGGSALDYAGFPVSSGRAGPYFVDVSTAGPLDLHFEAEPVLRHRTRRDDGPGPAAPAGPRRLKVTYQAAVASSLQTFGAHERRPGDLRRLRRRAWRNALRG